MPKLSLKSTSYEPVVIEIDGKSYTVPDITAETEEKLKPLQEITIFGRPGALLAQRETLAVLLGIGLDKIKHWPQVIVKEAVQFIYDSIGEGKKKEEKKLE